MLRRRTRAADSFIQFFHGNRPLFGSPRNSGSMKIRSGREARKHCRRQCLPHGPPCCNSTSLPIPALALSAPRERRPHRHGLHKRGAAVSTHCSSQIKSPAELKGKVVGSSRIGAGTDFLLRRILSKLGLVPGKDVSLIPTGVSESEKRIQ